MEKHPIENIMRATLENINSMIDVNTVVGSPVATAQGSTVIPISRVSFGFASGGGEYSAAEGDGVLRTPEQVRLPFAGGSGAGVSITPVGFLVVDQKNVGVIRTDGATPLERVTELAPKVLEGKRREKCGQGRAGADGGISGEKSGAGRKRFAPLFLFRKDDDNANAHGFLRIPLHIFFGLVVYIFDPDSYNKIVYVHLPNPAERSAQIRCVCSIIWQKRGSRPAENPSRSLPTAA